MIKRFQDVREWGGWGKPSEIAERDLYNFMERHFVFVFDNYLQHTFGITEQDFVKIMKEKFPEELI